MPLNNTVDQALHEVLVIDGLQMRASTREKRGRETQRRKVSCDFSKQSKGTLTFWRKIRFHLHSSFQNEILFVPDEAGFSSFEDCKELQSFPPPSHLKVITFHLYIVFRLWF